MNESEVKPTGVLSGGTGAVSVALVCVAFTDKFTRFVFVLIILALALFLGLPRPVILPFSLFDKSTLNKGTVGNLAADKGIGSKLSEVVDATGGGSTLVAGGKGIELTLGEEDRMVS